MADTGHSGFFLMRHTATMLGAAVLLAACDRAGQTVPPAQSTPTPARAPAAQAPPSDTTLSPAVQFARELATFSTGSPGQAEERARELMGRYPEHAAAILEAFGDWLFRHDPAAAVAFSLAHAEMVPGPEGEAFVSRLLNAWNEADPPALQDHLHGLAEHLGGTEFDCERTLRLLMLGEDSDFQPDHWLAWVGTLSKGSGDKGELQGAALDAMLSLIDASDPAQLAPLATAYRERITDPGLQKHLPDLGDAIARHSPGEAASLLTEIPEGLYRQEVLQRIIGELGRSHPDTAAEWLSSPDVLGNIFRSGFDGWREEALAAGASETDLAEADAGFQAHVHHMFDDALETYIFAIIDAHPEDAVASIDGFTDPRRRDDMHARVRPILEAMAQETATQR